MPEEADAKAEYGVVYCLFDPRNPRVPKYIGRTTVPLQRRLAVHLSRPNTRPNAPVSKWVVELRALSLVPTIVALETVSMEFLSERETHWIRFYRPLGSLLNKSDGDGRLGLGWKTKKGITRAPSKAKHLSHAQSIARSAFSDKQKARRKAVVSDDGREFESMLAAAITLGTSHANVQNAVKRGYKCGGAHWRFKNPTTTKEIPCP